MSDRKNFFSPGGIVLMLLVVAGSFSIFRIHLDAEEFFPDEAAHIAQTYYYRLFIHREWNHEDWLHLAAFDHLPIYKYLIGLGLQLAGKETPNSIEDIRNWYRGNFDPPADKKILHAARMPMLLGAVLGCLMMYLLGRQLSGPLTGLLAAGLLAISPLYYTHARRAMADCLTQALVLASFVLIVSLARALEEKKFSWRKCFVLIFASGLACGLAAATKLNGGIAALAFVLFALVSVIGSGQRSAVSGQQSAGSGQQAAVSTGEARKRAFWFLGSSLLVGMLAVVVFVGINPYLYAKPDFSNGEIRSGIGDGPPTGLQQRLAARGIPGRIRYILEYRVEALREGQNIFPKLALKSIGQRLRAIVREGMGRWTAAGYLPVPGLRWFPTFVLVCTGLLYSWSEGRAQSKAGKIPTIWLLLVWPVAEVAILCKNLTLDFDRYYMGVVAWNSLLSVFALAALWRSFTSRLFLQPPNFTSKIPTALNDSDSVG